MAGNVAEWVADIYSSDYYSTLSFGEVLDPIGPSEQFYRFSGGYSHFCYF